MEKYSIVIPTINEKENLKVLLPKLINPNCEIIIVDDGSTDGTKELVGGIRGVKLVEGDRGGLTSAILRGIKETSSEVVVVMDGDGQHRSEDIQRLLRPIFEGYDLVVGSRYIENGASPGFTFKRKFISRIACLLSYPFLTRIKDNTSGFFAVRKGLIGNIRKDIPKILLEVLVKGNYYTYKEVPITFSKRIYGISKFYSKRTVVAFAKQVLSLYVSKYLRLGLFGAIAVLTTALIFAGTYILTEFMGLWYMLSMLLASAVGLLLRFSLEKVLVFPGQKEPKEADYEWNAWYKGNPIQKYWKRKIGKIIVSFSGKPDRILDLGCGSSPLLNSYHCEGVGIDSNEEKIRFMRSRAPESIRYEVGDIRKVQAGKEFDLVIISEVLEHLSNPEELLSRVSSVLAKDGKLVIATPDYSKLLWRIAEEFTPYKEEHRFRFTRESLEKICFGYGLKPIKHKYVFGCDLVEVFKK